MESALILAAWALALISTQVVRHYAERLKLVQAPNHRSSHVKPTPHGGGIGIIVGSVVAFLFLAFPNTTFFWPVLALALLVAAVGLYDDVREMSARARMVAQLFACSAFLFLFPPLIPEFVPSWLWLGLLVFAGVWWINLYNFMDGIDGIAAMQALCMLLTALTFGYLQMQHDVSLTWWSMAALAAATFGFLYWNWPPAKIFMGDVGSTYLAFLLFAFALLSIHEGWMRYPAWIILGASFITDATVTLLQRIRQREPWFQAHRSHVYQRLSRRLNSHKRVTLLYTAINLLWLAPLSYMSLIYSHNEWWIAALAHMPLLIAARHYKAGMKE